MRLVANLRSVGLRKIPGTHSREVSAPNITAGPAGQNADGCTVSGCGRISLDATNYPALTGTESSGAQNNKGKGVAASANTHIHRTTTQPPNIQESLAPSKQSFQSANFEAPRSISQSTTVSVSVRSVVAGVFMDWPDPPRAAGDLSDNGRVRCPYCFDLLDQAEINSKTKWRFVFIPAENACPFGLLVVPQEASEEGPRALPLLLPRMSNIPEDVSHRKPMG
jgi:hypothetical protein